MTGVVVTVSYGAHEGIIIEGVVIILTHLVQRGCELSSECEHHPCGFSPGAGLQFSEVETSYQLIKSRVISISYYRQEMYQVCVSPDHGRDTEDIANTRRWLLSQR